MQLNINSIIILDNRQRRSNRDIDDQFVASVARRLINPITLRNTDDGPTLVAGERRLLALQAAKITTLTQHTHFRFLEDLDPEEAEIVELEENVKRKDLTWRDYVSAVGRIVELRRQVDPNTFAETIARELSITSGNLSMLLFVHRNLDSSNLRDATSYLQAYSILQSIAERRTVSIVQEIAKTGNQLFNLSATPTDDSPTLSDNPSIDINSSPNSSPISSQSGDSQSSPEPSDPPILNADFIAWANTYSGDKFTLIHCDFPYDVKYDSYARSISSVTDDYDFTGYWPLMDALIDNIDRLMSYSAHMLFWFSMKFYQQTRERLEKGGLYVHEHPFVWHKTDNSGIIPGRDGLFPRRIYETAFLASRGRRPLVRSLANCYGSPMQSNAIHPSTKPIPVLNHFLSMLVDNTTDVLDPTAGSGNALVSAENLGARRIVGLELNLDYAKAANATIESARRLRKLTQ